jgi:hypothetical protein
MASFYTKRSFLVGWAPFSRSRLLIRPVLVVLLALNVVWDRRLLWHLWRQSARNGAGAAAATEAAEVSQHRLHELEHKLAARLFAALLRVTLAISRIARGDHVFGWAR